MSKGSKLGRNKRSPSGKAYIAERREERNRAKKLNIHVNRHPNDLQAIGK